jgi:hypothetical protein
VSTADQIKKCINSIVGFHGFGDFKLKDSVSDVVFLPGFQKGRDIKAS